MPVLHQELGLESLFLHLLFPVRWTQNPTRPSSNSYGLAVEACSEFRRQCSPLCALTRLQIPEPKSTGGFLMRTWLAGVAFQGRRLVTASVKKISAVAALLAVSAVSAMAQPAGEAGG